MKRRVGLGLGLGLALGLGLSSGISNAQEVTKSPWNFTAKLTAVWAGGNSESNTFGLGSTLRYARAANELKFEAGGIRTESDVKTRRAVGTTSSYRVDETSTKTKTAESYNVKGRYDRNVSKTFLVYTGADWLRNTFAGIDSRFLVAAGAGNIWANRDDFKFKTDYAVTYTVQNDVVRNPAVNKTFPGLRASWDLMRKLTKTSQFESVLIGDLNLDNTDDVRVDFANALSVAISSRFSLKPGLQLLWRNQPALTAVPLYNSLGVATGQTVLVPLEKMDSFFTLAVVATF